MAQAPLTVQVPLNEIYAITCKKCRKKIRQLVKEMITDQLVDRVMGVEEKKEG